MGQPSSLPAKSHPPPETTLANPKSGLATDDSSTTAARPPSISPSVASEFSKPRSFASIFGIHGGLPEPTGAYPVSVVDYETPSTDPDHPGVLLRIYYPSAPASHHHPRAYWLPHPTIYAIGYGSFLRLPKLISKAFAVPLLSPVKTPAFIHAPLLVNSTHAQGRWPVMVFSHGLGGMRTTYSSFVTDCASHGWIVAAVEHRDGSAVVATKNGEKGIAEYQRPEQVLTDSSDEALLKYRKDQVEIRVKEITAAVEVVRAIDAGAPPENLMAEIEPRIPHLMSDHAARSPFDFSQFAKRIDMDTLVVAGHSFGGATSIVVGQRMIGKPKALITLDPWMYAVDPSIPISVPILSVNTETFNWRKNAQAILELSRNTKPTTVLSIIKGTAHQDPSDLPALFPSAMKRLKMGGTEKPLETLKVLFAITQGFLDIAVNGMEVEKVRSAVNATGVLREVLLMKDAEEFLEQIEK
ncbi:platelet-activating factor acetylhydrolase, isoform II-domain-containing protein [Cladochytrium replicatum]|nr:platelet-activating factor acetylhydrolase, isoform II-domain-containing protein [Cladochytrium replicatum]